MEEKSMGASAAEAFADGPGRPEARARKSAWLEELQGKLAELCALPEDWDGYDGRAVPFPPPGRLRFSPIYGDLTRL